MEGTEETSNTSPQKGKDGMNIDEQLKHLTSDFKGQCKVLDGVGRFSKTVKLNPENHDLVINFKLTGKPLLSSSLTCSLPFSCISRARACVFVLQPYTFHM